MDSISKIMALDHERLDALLIAAARGRPGVDLAAFGNFRDGIFRHMGIEEKILLPALLKASAAYKPLSETLRLHHGAISNLLYPSPSQEIIRALKAILKTHNPLEEGPAGVYDACDSLLAPQALEIIGQIRSAPKVPLRDYSLRPQALEAAKRAMQRAGFNWDECI